MTTTLSHRFQQLEEQLDAAWERRYGAGAAERRRRRRRATGFTFAALALSVAAAATGVLRRTSGPGSVDQALAAVGKAPSDSIVHFTSGIRRRDGAVTDRFEVWAATSPPYARRWIMKRNGAPPIEQGAHGNEFTQFDPDGVVYVRTLQGGVAEGTHPPDLAPDREEVKRMLRDWNAREVGEVTIDGERIRRFVMSGSSASLRRAPPAAETCIYDVQADTFFAVRLTCGGPAGSDFQRWEYLPRAGNERLLSVEAQHPAARLDRAPVGECGSERHTASTPPCLGTSAGG